MRNIKVLQSLVLLGLNLAALANLQFALRLNLPSIKKKKHKHTEEEEKIIKSDRKT
jgi:hypothetical protein